MAKLGNKDQWGSYSERMIEVCNRYAMKPMCEHRMFCADDEKAIYVGQKHQLLYPAHRNKMDYWPEGWSLELGAKWAGLCSYSGSWVNGNYVLCNKPINTHGWQRPDQYNPGFACIRSKCAVLHLIIEPGH